MTEVAQAYNLSLRPGFGPGISGGRIVTNRLAPTITAALLCCVAMAAFAGNTFRCGSQLIQPGLSQAEVRAKCGEPTSQSVTTEDVRSGNQVVGKTQKARWTYASYSATTVLVFDGDRLVAIEGATD
jgi:hypothetical protein